MVDCSSGTYVRALARDLGAALGVGGHLARCGAPASGRSTCARRPRWTRSRRPRLSCRPGRRRGQGPSRAADSTTRAASAWATAKTLRRRHRRHVRRVLPGRPGHRAGHGRGRDRAHPRGPHPGLRVGPARAYRRHHRRPARPDRVRDRGALPRRPSGGGRTRSGPPRCATSPAPPGCPVWSFAAAMSARTSGSRSSTRWRGPPRANRHPTRWPPVARGPAPNRRRMAPA